jgi:hypothetical protein
VARHQIHGGVDVIDEADIEKLRTQTSATRAHTAFWSGEVNP